jgi:Reverse transcriptase (RNA-dependent DNA polymerase)
MGTWELVDPPEDCKIIGNKWVLVRKTNKEGEIVKYKARLVAKGYSQIPGMDYTDTFSPVVHLETIQLVMSTAAILNWEIEQIDVKGVYLNRTLEEEVYMEQPEGYNDGTGRVCRLKKTLYGLKQSGREWNIELDKCLNNIGFRCTKSD